MTRGKRTQVAQEAAKLVGQRFLRAGANNASDSASGLVRVVYHGSGLDLDEVRGSGEAHGVERLYQYARRHGVLHRSPRPNPGDLAFFNDTFDRNKDGLRNDPLTHVAVVERVENDGTVVLVHRVEQGVVRQRMNLSHPHGRRDPRTGKVWNHLLRPSGHGDAARTTAELLAGFATLYVDEAAPSTLASR